MTTHIFGNFMLWCVLLLDDPMIIRVNNCSNEDPGPLPTLGRAEGKKLCNMKFSIHWKVGFLDTR